MSNELHDLVIVRPMHDGDRNFVRSSWLRSYRELTKWAPKDAYFRLHHDVVEGLLARARCVVAAAKDDDAHVLGWACGEPSDSHPLLHFAYVKQAYRNHGLATKLVDAALEGSPPRERAARTLTHAVSGSLSEKLRASGWAIHPPLAFYLALESREEEVPCSR